MLPNQVASTVHSFFLCMALHPGAQALAQEELDAVMGPHRLPVLADREHLPYMNALVKEVLRWAPAGPLGMTMYNVETPPQTYHILYRYPTPSRGRRRLRRLPHSKRHDRDCQRLVRRNIAMSFLEFCLTLPCLGAFYTIRLPTQTQWSLTHHVSLARTITFLSAIPLTSASASGDGE
jgi:hypothetical protein